MKYFVVFIFLLFSTVCFSQNDTLVTNIKGTVINNETKLPIGNVNVINASRVKGTTTTASGTFEIAAKVNDTLLFTFIGYENVKVKVTNDWIKEKITKIYLSEKTYVLDEVVIPKYNLTGYVEVDTKIIPVASDGYRFNISGINLGYEAGDKSPGAVSKILGSIFNPTDLLYNVFGKRPNEMKKLKAMKKDDTIRNLLATKFDRVTLATLLEIDKDDIPMILENCNYSEYFIKTANDLQIMDAISACYEDYKILKKNK
ncbi:carboxypeptidase-like regulatory domain-containing protein [Flavobacterium sp. HXWNR69]|uniref:Carboxypeptidase-like regulatory domain-containing protein n=1 Tax=Flavobacterium fragile TaxID=2949085 RepID=A0ABT0TKM1_9FLAO|nr:carboxypeptidase-like regulatory domain-containing protein [Flavobacterium sp. HXWNR69]MCL9771121.1 carboxypeptidase-like regulatory domain-containing protein [Flavobacterium sp. HXWNR69]